MNAPAPRSQPDIELVDDLRMDADMLKDGFQKNLTELWHSDVVREAAKNALRAADEIASLKSQVERMTKALEECLSGLGWANLTDDELRHEAELGNGMAPVILRARSALGKSK